MFRPRTVILSGAVLTGSYLALDRLTKNFPRLEPPYNTYLGSLPNRLNANTVTGYRDSYSLQIPRSSLLKNNNSSSSLSSSSSLLDQWTEAFANSTLLRLEGRLLFPLTSQPPVQASSLKPGDQILGGLFTVKFRTSNSLILEWSVPRWGIDFFNKAVQWGYPWKLPLGGFHELTVEEGGNGDDMVKFLFSSAHFYEGNDKLRMPGLVYMFHRTYARTLLWAAGKEVMIKK